MAPYGAWALVAGASEGLGAAFATALAARGYKLILVARRADALETVAVGLRSQVEVVTVALDLAAPDLLARVAALTEDREVGLLVYNAAYAPLGPFAEQSLEANLKAVDLNCRSPLALVHLFLPGMIARRRGGIVLMSSLTAFQGSPYTATYGATKAFNLSLGEALWYELGPLGVDVVVSCAGATRTPNYLRAAATGGAPGELEPAQVAEETLAALGNGPTVIPGGFNRFASLMMRRLLPRRTTIRIMGTQTRKLQIRG